MAAREIAILQQYAARVFAEGASKTRPWGSFFGAFDLPKGWPQYEKRLVANTMHYKTNYLVVASLVIVWAFLRSFSLLMAFSVIVPMWLYVYGAKKQVLVIPMGANGNKRLSKQETLYALLGATFVVLWLSGNVVHTILSLWIAGGLCFLHATVRPPTTLSKLNTMRFSIKNAFFGGGAEGRGDDAGAAVSAEDDDDEAFVVRDVAEGFRALLGMGKKRRGNAGAGASAAAAAFTGSSSSSGGGSKKASGAGKKDDNARGSSFDEGSMDIEGRGGRDNSSRSSGMGMGMGMGGYTSPFAPAAGVPAAPAPVPSGPVAGYYHGAPALPPNTVPSSSPSGGMPVFYDAPLGGMPGNTAGAGHEGSGFDDGIGGNGSGGLHGPALHNRRGGGRAGGNLPRPSDVKSA